MPRRLSYRSPAPIWIAVALALLLFAVAMLLVLSRLGPYDGSVSHHQVDLVLASIRA